MGASYIQCLIFFLLLGILSCSESLAVQGQQSSGSLRMNILKNTARTEKPSIHETEKKLEVLNDSQKSSHRKMIAETLMDSASSLPEMDVVTPVTTVPVLNPITPSTNVPTYNPYTTPTNPTVPSNNPYTTPTNPTVPTNNPYTTPTNPTTPTMTPGTNPYSGPAMVPPTSSGQSWCIASPTASGTALQVALDYACGYGGADCSQIQQGGSCFNPDTVRDHASYAFNNYYQKNPVSTSCDFGGTAMVTNIDPSTGTCQFPSSSTSSSTLNTTNPTGSSVFGSVPPSTSGTTTMPVGILVIIPVTCLLMSLVSLGVYI